MSSLALNHWPQLECLSCYEKFVAVVSSVDVVHRMWLSSMMVVSSMNVSC